jgi:hydrogenase maturation protein HypF
LGNLESFEAQTSYRAAMSRMLELLDVQPDVILTDRHPGYFTSQLGESLASALDVPRMAYGHHAAHFAAVLAEYGLMETRDPVLGVIWDGTGLGDDGNSWGGEFFLYRDRQFERTAHLESVPVLLGDKMALEPRLSALAFCHDLSDATALLESKFTPTEWALYNRKLDAAGIRTTSAGRLFDAVATMLGLADRQSYEGEAAMRLEALAWTAPKVGAYPLEDIANTGQIPTAPLLAFILDDIRRGRPAAEIAAAFHRTLIDVIAHVARQAHVHRIALSGGVWQNALLNAMAHKSLGSEFELIRHIRLSPNDECIPFGQLALWASAASRTQIILAYVPGHSR